MGDDRLELEAANAREGIKTDEPARLGRCQAPCALEAANAREGIKTVSRTLYLVRGGLSRLEAANAREGIKTWYAPRLRRRLRAGG